MSGADASREATSSRHGPGYSCADAAESESGANSDYAFEDTNWIIVQPALESAEAARAGTEAGAEAGLTTAIVH